MENVLGHLEAKAKQLEKGAVDINDELRKHRVAGINEELIHAVWGNDLQKVKELLDQGVDVNAKDMVDWTVLMHAARYGCTDTVRLLLEKGADVNAKAMHGYTALMVAARSGRVDTIRLLLDHGADPNAKDDDGYTALIWAEWEHVSIVKLLLDAGADPNVKNEDGNTGPLLPTEKAYYPDMVQLFKRHSEKK